MTLPLTPKQERVWRYLRSCDRSPTYREMERDLRAGNLNLTIATLKEKGFVAYVPGRARSLVAVEPGVTLAAFSTAALEAELKRRAQ